MTGKADFTPEEWELILAGPPSAGMIVVTAQRGGSFREAIAMAKAYVEARKELSMRRSRRSPRRLAAHQMMELRRARALL